MKRRQLLFMLLLIGVVLTEDGPVNHVVHHSPYFAGFPGMMGGWGGLLHMPPLVPPPPPTFATGHMPVQTTYNIIHYPTHVSTPWNLHSYPHVFNPYHGHLHPFHPLHPMSMGMGMMGMMNPMMMGMMNPMMMGMMNPMMGMGMMHPLMGMGMMGYGGAYGPYGANSPYNNTEGEGTGGAYGRKLKGDNKIESRIKEKNEKESGVKVNRDGNETI